MIGWMTSFDKYRRRKHFAAFDGLRCVSILLVLLHHTEPIHLPILTTLQRNGRYGVSMFFVISGFLICTLLLRERERFGRIRLGRFYARRSLRLFPLYYAVLLLYIMLVYGLYQFSDENRRLFGEKLPAYITYYSNWLPTATQGPFFFSWSLAVEEQFYLALSVLIAVAGNRATAFIVGVAYLLKTVVFGFHLIEPGLLVSRVAFSYQEPILVGVLLAYALHYRRSHNLLARVMRSRPFLVGTALAMAGMFAMYDFTNRHSLETQVFYLIMGGVVASTTLRPRAPLMGRPALVWVGTISYGIYLLHMLVINAMGKLVHLGPALSFPVNATLTIAVASVVYLYFERPIIRFYKERYS